MRNKTQVAKRRYRAKIANHFLRWLEDNGIKKGTPYYKIGNQITLFDSVTCWPKFDIWKASEMLAEVVRRETAEAIINEMKIHKHYDEHILEDLITVFTKEYLDESGVQDASHSS